MTDKKMVEALIFSKPESLTDVPTHYCPGCTHGVAHRLIAETIDEMGMREKVRPAGVRAAVRAEKRGNARGATCPP